MPQIKITKSRIIVLLTPFFAAASAAIFAWLIKTPVGNWLGLFHVTSTMILAGMVLGAASAISAACVFLHHNAFWEKYVAGVFDVVDDSQAPGATKAAPSGAAGKPGVRRSR